MASGEVRRGLGLRTTNFTTSAGKPSLTHPTKSSLSLANPVREKENAVQSIDTSRLTIKEKKSPNPQRKAFNRLNIGNNSKAVDYKVLSIQESVLEFQKEIAILRDDPEWIDGCNRLEDEAQDDGDCFPNRTPEKLRLSPRIISPLESPLRELREVPLEFCTSKLPHQSNVKQKLFDVQPTDVQRQLVDIDFSDSE